MLRDPTVFYLDSLDSENIMQQYQGLALSISHLYILIVCLLYVFNLDSYPLIFTFLTQSL